MRMVARGTGVSGRRIGVISGRREFEIETELLTSRECSFDSALSKHKKGRAREPGLNAARNRPLAANPKISE